MPSPSRSSFQTQGSWESHSSHGTHPDFESFQSCGSESCDQWLKLREDLKEIETARTSYRGNERLVMDEMNATLALAQKSIADDSHTDQMTRERLDETCFNAVSEGRSARLSIENSIGPRERDLFKTIDSLQQDIDTGIVPVKEHAQRLMEIRRECAALSQLRQSQDRMEKAMGFIH